MVFPLFLMTTFSRLGIELIRCSSVDSEIDVHAFWRRCINACSDWGSGSASVTAINNNNNKLKFEIEIVHDLLCHPIVNDVTACWFLVLEWPVALSIIHVRSVVACKEVYSPWGICAKIRYMLDLFSVFSVNSNCDWNPVITEKKNKHQFTVTVSVNNSD